MGPGSKSSSGVCCVAGVGPGVGAAVANRFAREGFKVVLLARRQQELEKIAMSISAQGGVAKAYALDLGDPGATGEIFGTIARDFGPVDVLVYNAARWHETTAMTISPATFNADLALCATGALACAQAVFPGMKAAGRGTMLFTGGGLALMPQYGTAVPSLTAGKSALRGLIYAMANELKGDRIHAALVTIAGTVAAGGAFDPDLIAESYWRLHSEPEESWSVEHVFRGEPAAA